MATIKVDGDEKYLVQRAYEAFNEYAGTKGEDDISGMPHLRRLQIEHWRWQAKALRPDSDQSLSTMVHGMTEELCWELVEAIQAGNEDEQTDSLGDLLVYTIAVCTNLRLDFLTLACDFEPDALEQRDDALMSAVKLLGMLNHIAGKEKQHTRGYEDIAQVREHAGVVISRLCTLVHWMCFANDWDVHVVLDSTLQNVMKRDWNLNQKTGDVSAQTALPLAE